MTASIPSADRELPRLPGSLLTTITEYGMARTDQVNTAELTHRWQSLIEGIKSYARSCAAPTQQVALAAEPIAWESMTVGYIKFITQRRYDRFSPAVRAWYKPYRCSACAAQAQDVVLTADDGYREAFYAIAEVLGIGARAASPKAVFEGEMLPKIKALVAHSDARAWVELTDADRERAFQSMPDMLDGFMKTWGWLHFAKAIEAICREKNGVPTHVADASKEKPS